LKGVVFAGIQTLRDAVLIDTEVTAFSNGQLPQQKLVFKTLESGTEAPAAVDDKGVFSPTL
jgi:ATP-dependent Clp protease ATP-binding subunit ClpB